VESEFPVANRIGDEKSLTVASFRCGKDGEVEPERFLG
jgi:hypothetical protein